MVGFKLWHTEIPVLMDCVPAWQASGLDGMTFNLRARREDSSELTQDSTPVNMLWGWWSPVRFPYSDFALDMQAIHAVKEWGRLTDNFFWGSGVSFFTDAEAPGWFDDEKWAIVLDNTTLLARLTREAGFKGIVFDTELYEQRTDQPWRRMWDYPLYKREGYKLAGEEAPRPFAEVSAQVLHRGRQWAQRLYHEYPEIVIMVLGSYWDTYRATQQGEALEEQAYALQPAFLDGVLLGLGESAKMVLATQGSYLMSEHRRSGRSEGHPPRPGGGRAAQRGECIGDPRPRP